jgi:hypothetical protein
MRNFNWRRAAITHICVLLLDMALETVSLVFFDQKSWWEMIVTVPFWIINFVGLPCVFILRQTSSGTLILALVLSTCLLGALFWAALVGYLFRHEQNA